MRQNLNVIAADTSDVVELSELVVYFFMHEQLSLVEYEEVKNQEVFLRKRWDRLFQYIHMRLPKSYSVLVIALEDLGESDIVRRLRAVPVQGNLVCQPCCSTYTLQYFTKPSYFKYSTLFQLEIDLVISLIISKRVSSLLKCL